MGVAYAFIFKFLLFSIFIFILSFVVSGVVTLIKIPSIYECTLQTTCNYNAFEKQYKNSVSITHFLGIANLILLIISKILFALHVAKSELKVDNKFLTVNDYTVYISGLNKNATEEEIIEVLDNHTDED